MKPATGSMPVLGKDGIWRFRLTFQGVRSTIALPKACSRTDAVKRRGIITELAKRMSHLPRFKALEPLQDVANAPDVDLKGAQMFCHRLIGGHMPERASGNVMTLRALCEWWNIGRLLPDGTRLLLQDEKPDECEWRSDGTRKQQARYLDNYALKLAGERPLNMIDESLANDIRASVPAHLRGGVRRQYLSPFKVVLDIAVKLKLIDHTPLPPEWLPKDTGPRDLQWIYPREDLKVMRNRAIPLCWRVLFGYLPRNGARELETCLMTLGHFDLEAGGAHLEEWMTKTGSRRWRLSRTDSWLGLVAWVAIARAGDRDDDARMFLNEDGEPINPKTIDLPALARKFLKKSGVTRRELFVTTKDSRRFVVHDYRASFCTVKSNQGWNNFQIRECTGHESDTQMEEYRRVAQSFADLDRGDFLPLHEAIPELAEYLAAHPECVPPAAADGLSHPIAIVPANSAESLSYPSYMVESVLGSQEPDMSKLPRNPPPSNPSSPVQPGAETQSLAFQMLASALADEVTKRVHANLDALGEAAAETLTTKVMAKLAERGLIARPRPTLVGGADPGDDNLKKR